MAKRKRKQNDDSPGLAEAERLIEQARRSGSLVLDLSGLGLRAVPESLGQLAQLQWLGLAGNQLTALPESLGQLTQLQKLYLQGNELTVLPESLGKLAGLQSLDLSGNELTSVPESLGKLAGLQSLDLSGNELTSVPESLGKLAELQTLYLEGNQLTSLPESLGQLAQLQWLFLSSNQLTTVPESLGKLAQLKTLLLISNQLTAVPESLGQLAQLQELHLDGNQLTTLPESLERLSNLQELYLHGNDGLGIPPEVLGPTWEEIEDRKATPTSPEEILRYYFRLRGGRRPLNELKLILLGRGGVGKTSLVNRLVHDRFDPHSPQTDGIKITHWPVTVDGEQVRLHVWDFGGQEIMHATHQFFLTERSLYLVVLSGREGGEDADAEYWLKLVASFGGDSPVVVVLNKCRQHLFDLNRGALRQKYPNIRAFVTTDCAEKVGIGELSESLNGELSRWDARRVAFPSSWFAIKDRLAAMDENYLSFEQFRQVCRDLGERDGGEQDALAGYLHTLGIALNYKDDPRLRDTHVLNPHWVTKGIYRILNAPLLADRQGALDLNDLPEILPAADYPRDTHLFVLDLMRKFDLCFTFSDSEGQYLVPELLDKQQPVEAETFSPADCLAFEYRYPILPEGLLPRFIVRTHVLSEGEPRWRSGVILKFEGCRALVKADVQDKTVQVLVAGPNADGRRRLLAVIRADFERIHASIAELKPQEMVPVPEWPGLVVPYQKLKVLEENGVHTLNEVFADEMIELPVASLLNGVDLAESRRRGNRRIGTGDRSETDGPLRLFFSYSRKDEVLRNELETHLKILERRGLIAPWYDSVIVPGQPFADEIDENLERADVILFLISADFIASEYCYATEMTRALERDAAGEATVIPVFIRDVNWKQAPFAPIQGLPSNGQAVTLWPDKDSAWRNVSEGIERAVEARRKRRRS